MCRTVWLTCYQIILHLLGFVADVVTFSQSGIATLSLISIELRLTVTDIEKCGFLLHIRRFVVKTGNFQIFPEILWIA